VILLPKSAWAFGGIDAKVTNLQHMKSMETIAISGPSFQNQPPFEFKGEFDNTPHLGMPQLWQFQWQQMKPTK